MVYLDLVLGLFDCLTEEDWAATLFSIADKCGFKYALYGSVENKGCPLEKAFLKSNYPRLWRATYEQSSLHTVDPIVEHCLSSSLPIVWTPQTFHKPEHQIFYEEASGYGLRYGVSYPVHGAKGDFGILSLVSDQKNDDELSMELKSHFLSLGLIRDYVFESSLKFSEKKEHAQIPVKLTHREIECLSWAMAGKSSWEISRIKRCSEATVNFHIANVKTKFQVRTRQQAIVKAIKHGLLTPS